MSYEESSKAQLTEVPCLRAEFVGSYPSFAALPPETVPEVAFVGRSNVGKSSLLNVLVNRKGLARVGKTPGVTRAVNLFDVTYRFNGEDLDLRIADLPGYGYAKVSHKERGDWNRELSRYLNERAALKIVCVLLDARRDLTFEEEFFFSQEFESWLVVTKLDQLTKLERKALEAKLKERLPDEKIFYTSADKRNGISDLQSSLCSAL